MSRASVYRRIVDKFFEISDSSEADVFLLLLKEKPDSNTHDKLFHRTEKSFAILQCKLLIAMARVFAETLDGIEERLDHIEHRITE